MMKCCSECDPARSRSRSTAHVVELAAPRYEHPGSDRFGVQRHTLCGQLHFATPLVSCCNDLRIQERRAVFDAPS